jgi:DNA-binding transcriptional regulator GbsR (MarR family)
MNYKETQEEFIQLWGSLGSNWGISKAMAQIHALLLSVENPMTTDEIMEALTMSRSNANLNVRMLLDWGLVYKKSLAGDRKEYFIAEKDIWQVAIKIIKERRRREVEPIINDLKKLNNFEANNFEEKNFKNVLSGIIDNADRLNSMANMVEQFDKVNFFKWFNTKSSS